MENYLISGFIIASFILLIVIIVKLFSINSNIKSADIQELIKENQKLNFFVTAEFDRLRRESNENQSNLRKEINFALDEMNTKLEKSRIESAENQSNFEKSVIKTINEIKISDIEQNEKQNRIIALSMDKMKESNEKRLEEIRLTVDEKLSDTLSSRLDSSFKTVSDRLESVYKSLGEMKELSNGVTTNITALNRVLTNVKARGTWAEIQLSSILDQTIPGMYETNFCCTPGSDERVEFAVKIPSSDGATTYLPIDSKFPMEDYIRLCCAADNADIEGLKSARKDLESKIINEAKTISKYINVPLTTPYAIMYLATEGLYAEIASSKTGISEKLRSDFNIMIAGPSTITALLNSMSLGFKAVAINEKANEVRILLAAAKQQYDKFGITLQKAKKKIEEAGNVIEEADKRNEVIRKKLNRIEEIDDESAKVILGLNDNNKFLMEEEK